MHKIYKYRSYNNFAYRVSRSSVPSQNKQNNPREWKRNKTNEMQSRPDVLRCNVQRE